MKRISILSLGIMFGLLVQSQDYHKLINDSLYWDVSNADEGYICEGFGSFGPKRYKLSGDTLINGNIYSKVYYSTFINLNTPPAPWCPPFDVDTVFTPDQNFFIREDTIEKKVWRYMEIPYPEETLLFDFSVEQGDTITYDGMPDVIIDTVYNIVTDDGLIRRKIEWESDLYLPGGFYIEGLGGAAGPFQIPYNFIDFFGSGPWLMCVNDKENMNIWSKNQGCYDFVSSVPKVKANHFVQIFPNPAKKIITIESSFKSKIKDIIIYNQSGQKALSTKSPSNTIDISNLKPGLYFAEIKTSEGNVMKKIIVQ